MVARALHATLWRPVYPRAGWIRLMRDGDRLVLDFLPAARSSSNTGDYGGLSAGFAEVTQRQRNPKPPGTPRRKRRLTKHEALRLESERALDEMIRRWLAVPMEKRTHFLRKRVGIRASCL